MCKPNYQTDLLDACQIISPLALDALSISECSYLYNKDTITSIIGPSSCTIIPIISPIDSNNEKIDLITAWRNRMKQIISYQKRMPSVEDKTPIALYLIMRCPEEAFDDITGWMGNSIRWLIDTFDIAPDGKSNLLALSLHTCREDATKVALYATIIPIDENGEFISDYSENSVWNEETLLSSYKEAIHFTDKEDAAA